MKSFRFNTFILSLFLLFQISYSQDFIDDLYISTDTYDSFYSNNDDNSSDDYDDSIIVNDTIYDDYDDEIDYEDRINKFHNPNYRFRYCWNYGWNDRSPSMTDSDFGKFRKVVVSCSCHSRCMMM